MSDVPQVVRNDWSTLSVGALGAWRPTLSVSVVIPAYECQESLDLVLAALAGQTYPAELTEVLVVDDGSKIPLRLPEIRPRNCRVVRVPDGAGWGIANACNVGVAHSSGDVVQRLDADMVVFPEHVEAHARWHHAVPYAVTLGAKRFVDVRPGQSGWPTPEAVARAAALPQLFAMEQTEPHDYIEKMVEDSDELRAADHLAFLAHVGATVAVRRTLFEEAGGYAIGLRRGSDTEFGYRLAQAGAVFVPESAARSWHLGPSGMMRTAQALQRYSRPYMADLMPQPRWLRKAGGTAWTVPLVVASVDVDGQPFELVRAAVDAVLRGDEQDLRLDLVGDWDRLVDEPRAVLTDPYLDLRLIQATYRGDPRVRLVRQAPRSAFPSPFLLRLPATAGLGRTAIRRMVDEADRHQAGLVRVASGADAPPVELWRTAALGRARWAGGDIRPLDETVAGTHGVRSLPPEAVGVVDLSRVPADQLAAGGGVDGVTGTGGWLPATVEVGGVRSLARATAVVARLSAVRMRARARRVVGRRLP